MYINIVVLHECHCVIKVFKVYFTYVIFIYLLWVI